MTRFHQALDQHMESKLKAIYDHMLVVEFSLDGTLLYANECFLTLMGYQLEEVLGQNHRLFVDLAHEDAEQYELFWQRLANGESFSAEYKRLAKGGRRVWLNACYCPLIDENDTPYRIVKFATNFTPLHHVVTLSQALLQEQSVHKGTLLEMTQAYEDALHTLAQKSELMAELSHELRTPLQAMLGLIELLIEDLAQRKVSVNRESMGQDLHTIRTSGMHMKSLLDGYLDLTKIEAGKLYVVSELFSLHQMLEELSTTMTPLLLDTQSLTVDSERLPNLMLSDKVKVRQVLINLVSNALKFTQEGHIWIRSRYHQPPTHQSRGWVCLEVEDQGRGMSEEVLRRVFEPYEQETTATHQQFGGTGLGLTLCVKLVQMLGGTLQVESKPGHGSTFQIHLPLELPASPLL